MLHLFFDRKTGAKVSIRATCMNLVSLVPSAQFQVETCILVLL